MTTPDAFYAETGVTLRPEEAGDLTGLLTNLAAVLDHVGDDAGIRRAVAERFGAEATPHDLAGVLHRLADDLQSKAAAESVVISTETAPGTSADF